MHLREGKAAGECTWGLKLHLFCSLTSAGLTGVLSPAGWGVWGEEDGWALLALNLDLGNAWGINC